MAQIATVTTPHQPSLCYTSFKCSGLSGYTSFPFCPPWFILLAGEGAGLCFRIVLFLPRGKYSRCRLSTFRMCKGPKTCESRHPYMATVTPSPFASYHARREQDHRPAPKPTVSYLPPTKCMEEGIRAGGFLWLIWSSFRRKGGGMGAGYGMCGKSGVGHHTADLPTLKTHYQIPIP